MSSWLDDRLRAAARLLLPPSVNDPKIVRLYDPRAEHDALPISESRQDVLIALSLIEAPNANLESRAKAVIKHCAALELRLRPTVFSEAWDAALAIAVCKVILPDYFSDHAAQQAIQHLIGLRGKTQFSAQAPSWQLQALADLALLASADRPNLTDALTEPLRTLVSDLTLFRSRDDALVEFGGGPADPALCSVLTELPFGGINSTSTVGRLAWQAHGSDCVLWLGPGPTGMPTIELWQDGQPILVTGVGGRPSNVMVLAPAMGPAQIKVRRRDTAQTQSLEAVCATGGHQGAPSWGRTVTVDAAEGRIDIEDWLLLDRQQKPPTPWIEAIEMACPSDVVLGSVDKLGIELLTPSAQRWALAGPNLKWQVGAVDAHPQFLQLRASVPEAERHRLRTVRWSIASLPSSD